MNNTFEITQEETSQLNNSNQEVSPPKQKDVSFGQFQSHVESKEMPDASQNNQPALANIANEQLFFSQQINTTSTNQTEHQLIEESFNTPNIMQVQSHSRILNNIVYQPMQDQHSQYLDMTMTDVCMELQNQDQQLSQKEDHDPHGPEQNCNSQKTLSSSNNSMPLRKKQFTKKFDILPQNSHAFMQRTYQDNSDDKENQCSNRGKLVLFGANNKSIFFQHAGKAASQRYQQNYVVIDKLGKILPTDLQFFMITKFLSPSDIAQKMLVLSRSWHSKCSKTLLWKLVNTTQPLKLNERLIELKCIVERRSKGRLSIVKDRITQERQTLRRISLEITNAGQDDGFPASILREISILQCMEHQNVNKIREVRVKQSKVSLLYDYHEYNLKEYVRRFSKPFLPNSQYLRQVHNDKPTNGLTLDNMKQVLFQIVKGLAHIHGNGIMHRNLKPDNILITHENTVKLTDFNLARITSIPHFEYTPEDPKERERSGRESKRLWYRAPELLLRKLEYSQEVDMWSVGCIFAELALGQILFSGESEIEQLFQIFRFTGSPDQETLQSIYENQSPEVQKSRPILPIWQAVPFKNICYGSETQEAKDLIQAYIPQRENALTILCELKERIGYQGLDLLQRLLELNPTKRLSAQQCLTHPFFQSEVQKTQKASQNASQIMTSINEMQIDSANPFSDQFTHETIKIQPEDTAVPKQTEFLRKIETRLAADYTENFKKMQTQITGNMRTILIDWLVDVAVHFEVKCETLHLSIHLIDRYLSNVNVEKVKLQLVGISCMKIGDVFNERSKEYYRQENAIEYAYITADEYTDREVVQMEKDILNQVQFNLYRPTCLSFINLYNTVLDLDDRVLFLTKFLADLSLLSLECNSQKSSLMASACIFVAQSCIYQSTNDPNSLVHQQLLQTCYQEFGHWHTQDQFFQCVQLIFYFWQDFRQNPAYLRFDAINNKFEQRQKDLMSIRQIQLPFITSQDCLNWMHNNSQEDHEMV